MLKKNEVITILANGGHITLSDVYRSATVYARNGERLDSCRYDTAERIGSMDGYTIENGSAWCFTRTITDDSAADIREYTETTTEEENETMTHEITMTTAREMRAARAALVEAHHDNDTPAATVAALVAELGEATAREIIARMVIAKGTWDCRLSRATRAWAAELLPTVTETTMDALNVWYCDEIHPAHMEQIAQAMREYVAIPAEDIEAAVAETVAEELAAEAVYRAEDVNTLTIIECSSARALYGAILHELRSSRHYDEPAPAWIPAGTDPDTIYHAARAIDAAYRVDAAQQEAARQAAEEAAQIATERAAAERRENNRARSAAAIQRVKDALQAGGYICQTEDGAALYDDHGHTLHAIPAATVARAATWDDMATWREDWGGQYVARDLGKRHTDHENRERCRRIAENLDDYAAGRVYRCECGELLTIPDDCERYRCPDCGETFDVDDLEQCSVYDYLEDCLDIEYRCDSRRKLRSVQVMVACGGPNIYLDTASGDVELYWWSDRARYPMSREAREAIDDWAQECWEIC